MSARFSLRMRDYLGGAPEQKRFYNERLFTEVAPRYDLINRLLSFGRDQHWKRRLVAALPALARPRCLDLACGTGDLTRLVAAKYPDGEVVGLDLTPAMLELAARLPTPPNVTYRLGDMGQLDQPAASVDVVTGGYALRNAPDLTQALREVARVLKPGGIAAFLDFSRPVNRWGQRVELALLTCWGAGWGWLLHRNPEVYTYIAASLKLFPDRRALRALMQAEGFEVVSARRFFFGVMELLVLRKPGAPPAGGARTCGLA